jgi:hypothetical protein
LIKKFTYGYILGIVIGVLLLIASNNTIAAQDQKNTTTTTTAKHNQTNTTTTIAGLNQFNPVPFKEIPLVVINSTYREDKFGADFSLDFGDGTVIEQDFSASSVPNMRLDKDDTNLSLQLLCDSNDMCDASLAPQSVPIYLVDDDIQDIHIAENSIPTLQLGSNNCGSLSIEDCANFTFSIPGNIILGNYKIVVETSFDEAEWIFINPVEIVDLTSPPATLTVIKQVINDNGGTAQASDFTFQLFRTNCDGTSTGSGPLQASAGGLTYPLPSSICSYRVLEQSSSGYTSTKTGDCEVSAISPGATYTCTIVNNDNPISTSMANLTVFKQVINDNGGTAQASDFTFSVSYIACNGTGSGTGPMQASAGGVTLQINSQFNCSYEVGELVPEGYTLTAMSGDCQRSSISPNATYTCTIVNDDNPRT